MCDSVTSTRSFENNIEKLMKKRASFFFDLSFTVLLFFLPLSTAIPNLVLPILAVFFVLKKKKKQPTTHTILVVVFCLYMILKSLFYTSFIATVSAYNFFFILLLITILTPEITNHQQVKKGFIFGVLTAVFLTLINVTMHYIATQTVPLGNTVEANYLLVLHRPYLGILCFIASVFAIETAAFKGKNRMYYVFAGVLALFTLLIVARLALFLTLIYLFVKALKNRKRANRKQQVYAVLLMLVVGAFLFLNPNLKRRIQVQESFEKTKKVMANQEPRVVIWPCAIAQLQSPQFHKIFGFQTPEAIEKQLVACYQEKIDNVSKRDYYVEKAFHTHNQFLGTLLLGGALAFLLLLGIFGHSLSLFYRNKTMPWVVLGILLFCLLENVLHRQLGVYILGIFIPLAHHTLAKKNE